MLPGMPELDPLSADPAAPSPGPGAAAPSPGPGAAAPAPLIAVTVGDPARSHDPSLAVFKNNLYAAAIARQGGKPVLVSTLTPAAERARVFAAMDGLLLTGGADIDPARYGQPVDGAVDLDPARDELELAAWRETERRGLPVYGVCRGIQAINVFAGGSLIQDVPSHAGTPYGSGPALTHDLELDPAGLIAQLTDADTLTVNSYHHQAIALDGLAPGLRPNAWSASEAGRLIEGLEGTGDRWIVGIQCHPERAESTPAEFEAHWQAFVDAARSSRSARVGAAAESSTAESAGTR
jgi:putative glutamine amidotransferase